MAARDKDKGCYHCMKRRIICDKALPGCAKCLKKGLTCPGYGIRYRFAPKAAASSNRCTSLSSSQTPAFTAPTLLWPDGSKVKLTPNESESTPTASYEPTLDGAGRMSESVDMDHDLDVPACSPTGQSILHVESPTNGLNVLSWSPLLDQQSLSINALDWPDSNDDDAFLEQTTSLALTTVPSTIEILDWRMRDLFDHFSTRIAPVMVVVDSMFNGYRNLILPLAFENPLVKTAVCVASLYHRAADEPNSQHRAELGLQQILSQLRQRTLNSDLVDIPAWTTLIILLTAETINGGLNLPHLFRLLQHLANANAKHDNQSVMHTFLAEQTRMMTFLAQPSLDPKAGAVMLSQRSENYLDFISNIATFQPALARELGIYKSAICLASDIYVRRATEDPPYAETVTELDQLQTLCEEVDPATPGHHTLVWVYFIAAAESSILRHRDFFTVRLQEVFARTKFNNIPAALGTLKEMWKVQTQERWTEILPRMMPVFVI